MFLNLNQSQKKGFLGTKCPSGYINNICSVTEYKVVNICVHLLCAWVLLQISEHGP